VVGTGEEPKRQRDQGDGGDCGTRRRCHGQKYQSQYEQDCDRAIAQANRIRERLGDTFFTACDCDLLPDKPKRMRWTSYRRFEADYQALQMRWKKGPMDRFGPQVLQWR